MLRILPSAATLMSRVVSAALVVLFVTPGVLLKLKLPSVIVRSAVPDESTDLTLTVSVAEISMSAGTVIALVPSVCLVDE